MTDKQPSLDGWDDFTGDFIKTDLIKEFPVTLVPVDIESQFDTETKKGRMFIKFQYNKRDWKMELNKTNQNFIRASGLVPKEIVGKKLVFDKVMNRNPSTGQPTPSFLIIEIK